MGISFGVEPAFIIIVLVFAILIAAGVYLGHVQAQRRRQELTAVASQIGWSFDANRDDSHEADYACFDIFQRGHSQYTFNTFTGAIDIHGQACAAKMGDYHYKVTSGSGKNRSTHTYRFSYLFVRLPYRSLPNLLIRQEGLFDAITSALGFADIDFESAEFSRRFHVKSADKRFAYDVIHAPVMEYMLASDPPTIAITEGRCCLSDGQAQWSPSEFREQIEWTHGFFDLWPKHVTSALADH